MNLQLVDHNNNVLLVVPAALFIQARLGLLTSELDELPTWFRDLACSSSTAEEVAQQGQQEQRVSASELYNTIEKLAHLAFISHDREEGLLIRAAHIDRDMLVGQDNGGGVKVQSATALSAALSTLATLHSPELDIRLG